MSRATSGCPPHGDDARDYGGWGPPLGFPRWARSRVLLPLVVGLIQILGTLMTSVHQPERRALDGFAFALLVAGPAALVFRRRLAPWVFLFVFAVTNVYNLMGYPDGPVFVSLVVAGISSMVRGHRWLTLGVLVAGYFSFVWLPYWLDLEPAPSIGEGLGAAAWVVAIIAFAEMSRGRRAQAIEAARSRREERRRRASEERLRIAQELHDVLAHNISLINVQAGVALHLIDDDPEQARSSLAAIKAASGDALSELRSVLDILRQDDPDVPRSPTPSLADLERLIDRTRSAGLDVSYERRGDPRALPSNVERAAFRIVQEALTNVVRHASGARASVVIAFDEDHLVVEVTDDGRGVAGGPSGGGNGIPGMRARTEALGGTFDAGRIDGGGFRVRAAFPLAARPREEVG